jgi:voltage-gated potassium channel
MTLARWKRLTEWPLTLAAVVFLLAYSWSVIGNLTGSANSLPEGTMTVTWALFGIDYVVSLILAKKRGQWFVRHLHDLAIVALPMLRPLRLLRLLALVSVLQRAAGSAFRGKIMLYTVASAALLVFLAGLAILDAEQNEHGANITNFGDALWWAFATITTVGYGDFYPITLVGRLIAVALMIAGIALIASVTAAFASWFLEQVSTLATASKTTDSSNDAQKDA